MAKKSKRKNSKFSAKYQRWDRFAIALLEEPTGEAAAIKAGYSPKSARFLATRLRKNPYVIKRLKELQERIESEKIANVRERKEKLSEIIRAKVVDFLDENGQPVITKNSPHAGAVKEFYDRVKYDRNGNPIRTRSIKLIDVIEAIRELNKIDGTYASQPFIQDNSQTINIIDVQGKILRLLEGRRNALRQGEESPEWRE
ncbi:terminase small subunit [Chloroflexota bacterium]